MSTPRTAVVTGGAAGIGRAFAARLAVDGHHVAVADVAPTEETERLVRGAGADFFSQRCDVADPGSVATFAAAVHERLGRVDVLVHNAGVYPFQTFLETDWEGWTRVMDVNLNSAFHLLKAFLPGMVDAGWGRIVMMSSTMFHAGTGGMIPYVVSKGGLTGLVRSLAAEVGELGVTVNALAPSLVRTPGTTGGAHDEHGMFEAISGWQAIKRTQVPEDLTGALSWLTGEEGSFITGQTLVIDGGWVRA